MMMTMLNGIGEYLIFSTFLIFNTVIILIWQCAKNSAQPTATNNNNNKKKGKNGGNKKDGSAFNSTKSGTSPARTISSVQTTKISSQESKNKKGGGSGAGAGAGGKNMTTSKNNVLPTTNGTGIKEQPTQTKTKSKNTGKNKNDGTKGVIKNAAKSKNPQNLSRGNNDKSLKLQSTQYSIHSGKQQVKLKATQSDDDLLHYKHGTPELLTDRTQKSISNRITDDEGTNSNIEELPMDKHKSE